jgi:RNA polymerase sigma-70 factor, ECF subfamily
MMLIAATTPRYPSKMAGLFPLKDTSLSSTAPAKIAAKQPAANDAEMRRCLLAIAARQDKSAFAALYRHFAPRLKSYCQRQGMPAETAEELAQEALVSVWRRAATFDPSKASVATWIFTIVRNKRIDLLRREKRPELKPEDFELLQEPEQTADITLSIAEEAGQIGRALEQLPHDQKAMLLKAFFEEKSHSEIAAETGLPLGTVKSRIRLALSRLKIGLNV